MITVNVNNTIYEFNEQSSLKDIIHHLKINEDGIAVAINQSIITKTEWQSTYLSNNDNILIIQATQGG